MACEERHFEEFARPTEAYRQDSHWDSRILVVQPRTWGLFCAFLLASLYPEVVDLVKLALIVLVLVVAGEVTFVGL